MSQLAQFLDALFANEDLIEIRPIETWLEGNGKKESRVLIGERRWVTTAEIIESADQLSLLTQAPHFANIFFGTCPRRKRGDGKAGDICTVRALWLDIDHRRPDEVLYGLRELGLPEPSIVVDSGHGTHLYWILEDPVNIDGTSERETVETVLNRLTETLGGDHCQDLGRVLRLPGFANVKNARNDDPPAPCKLVTINDTRYTLDQIEEYLPEAPEPPRTSSPMERTSVDGDHRAGPSKPPPTTSGTTSSPPPPQHHMPAFVRWGVEKRLTEAVEDRSRRDFDVLCWLQRERVGADVAYSVVAGHSKFADRNRSYFDMTWAAAHKAVGSNGTSGTFGTPPPGRPELFSDPQPIPTALPDVEPFDLKMLPEVLLPWIKDIAARVQCPVDFLAVAVMVAIAGVVGRRIAIRPKRYDDWTVIANLWAMTIGRPGILKTPAVQEALRPLKRLELEAKDQYEAELGQFEIGQVVLVQAKKVAEQQIRAAIKKGDDAHAIAAEAMGDVEDEPVRRRYLVNDATVEKLGELLNENPNGLTVYRDELLGLLRSLEKEGQEAARAFYLEAWNGNGRFTYDRIGRGTIDITATTISIIGNIQPGPLHAYLQHATRQTGADDGLIQRFQLAVWPDVPEVWENVDRWPDKGAKNDAFEVFARLDAINPASVGATRDENDPEGVPYLRFSDEAQPVFDNWRAILERQLRSGDEHPVIESHLAKYRSLIPSLALLTHLAEDHRGPVRVNALNKAIAWGKYLESHARRIYSVAVDVDVAAAKALSIYILRGDLKDGFSLRDVYRHHWAGLWSREDAKGAAAVLIDLNWLVPITERTGGAPKTRFQINPRILETPTEGGAKSAKSRGGEPSGTFGTPTEGRSSDS